MDQPATVGDEGALWRRPAAARILRLAGSLLALGLAVGFFVAAERRVVGDLLNSYPFVTLDGYDWLLEGSAVAALGPRGANLVLPVLRGPLYVLCVAADAALGGSGRWLFAVHAAAFLAQMALLWAAGELLGTVASFQLAMPLLLALSALATYRLAIFPDDLAIAWLLAGLVALLLWQRHRARRWLVLAGGAALLGALTQEYAALPLVAAVLLELAQAWRRRRPPSAALLLTAAASGATFLAASRLWSATIAHHLERDVVSVFRHPLAGRAVLLKFDLLLWLHVFWPLAGALLAAVVLLRGAVGFRRQAALLVGTTLVLMAGLILVYGWPDARFTYGLIPIVLMLCAAGWSRGAMPALAAKWPRPLRWLVSPLLATLLWCAQGCGWLPAWGRWRVEGIQPLHSADGQRLQGWPLIPDALALPPVDRFALVAHCGSAARFCAAAASPHPDNAYDQLILCEYRSLRLQGVVGRCPYDVPIRALRLAANHGTSTAPSVIDGTHLCLRSGSSRSPSPGAPTAEAVEAAPSHSAPLPAASGSCRRPISS
jgi:hypothetical protein